MFFSIYFLIQFVLISVESFSLPSSELQYRWYRLDNDDNDRKVNVHAAAFGPHISAMIHFVIHGFRTIESFQMRDDGRNHSRLIFNIYLARNLGYYLIQIYVPASLIVVISWIGFWVPRNSRPARVTLAMTTVLTMVTFTSLGTTGGLPQISYLKAIDFYLLTSFFMVFAALLEFAIVSYVGK